MPLLDYEDEITEPIKISKGKPARDVPRQRTKRGLLFWLWWATKLLVFLAGLVMIAFIAFIYW